MPCQPHRSSACIKWSAYFVCLQPPEMGKQNHLLALLGGPLLQVGAQHSDLVAELLAQLRVAPRAKLAAGQRAVQGMRRAWPMPNGRILGSTHSCAATPHQNAGLQAMPAAVLQSSGLNPKATSWMGQPWGAKRRTGCMLVCGSVRGPFFGPPIPACSQMHHSHAPLPETLTLGCPRRPAAAAPLPACRRWPAARGTSCRAPRASAGASGEGTRPRPPAGRGCRR